MYSGGLPQEVTRAAFIVKMGSGKSVFDESCLNGKVMNADAFELEILKIIVGRAMLLYMFLNVDSINMFPMYTSLIVSRLTRSGEIGCH